MGDLKRDCLGKEIRCGDILMLPSYPEGHGLRYHVCCCSGYGARYADEDRLEIRDLGNNNTHMWLGYESEMVNIGPFWEHLDKLSDDDLEYYFNCTRELAERIAKLGKGEKASKFD